MTMIPNLTAMSEHNNESTYRDKKKDQQMSSLLWI